MEEEGDEWEEVDEEEDEEEEENRWMSIVLVFEDVFPHGYRDYYQCRHMCTRMYAHTHTDAYAHTAALSSISFI